MSPFYWTMYVVLYFMLNNRSQNIMQIKKGLANMSKIDLIKNEIQMELEKYNIWMEEVALEEKGIEPFNFIKQNSHKENLQAMVHRKIKLLSFVEFANKIQNEIKFELVVDEMYEKISLPKTSLLGFETELGTYKLNSIVLK